MYSILKKIILFLGLFLATQGTMNAQSLLKDSVMTAFALQVNYQAQFPFADLQDRFGFSSAIGAALSFKMKKNFWFDLEGNFIFGSKINEPGLFDDITDGNGLLVGASGVLENVRLLERGFMLRAMVGKVIPIGKKPNINSGLYIRLGAGFMQHKIFIDLENKAEVPQLDEDYQKGYDRLSNGFMLSQFIGYMYLANNRRINFYTGVEFHQGFTQGRRTFNFDTRTSGEGQRFDAIISYKIAWLLPIYYKSTQKYYYY